LPGFKAQFRSKRGSSRGLFSAVAVVCVVLLALLVVAQVAHLHSSESDADHCPLCIVMHSAAPVAAAAVVIVVVHLGTFTPQAEPRFVARRPQSSLFIRPPPVSC
jgi:hypothetical protein